MPDPNEVPFTPFTPLSPPTAPVAPAAEKPKRERKKKIASKKKSKAAAVPAPQAPVAQPVTPVAEKPKRKTRKLPDGVKPNKRAPKFELQTILKATAGMKEADMPLFQKMLDQLQGAGKPTRGRIMTALGKVFV